MSQDAKSIRQINLIDNPRQIIYPNEILKGPWETISVDLIGPLPELVGYDGILVIVDHFSKMACYMPINMNITTQGVAKVSWD